MFVNEAQELHHHDDALRKGRIRVQNKFPKRSRLNYYPTSFSFKSFKRYATL